MVIDVPISISSLFECFFNEGCGLWDLVINTLSKSDDSLSLQVSSGDGTICHTKDLSPDYTHQILYVAGM